MTIKIVNISAAGVTADKDVHSTEYKVIKVVFKDIFGFAGAEFFMWPSLLDVALLPVCLSVHPSICLEKP